MINREAIFAALFATVAGVPGFNTTSRKLKHWSDVAPADQPALFMTQGRETAVAPYRQPTKWTLRASLYVYTHQNSLDILPSTALNQLIDAIEKALAPGTDGEQTLGLVAQTPAFVRNSPAIYTDINAIVQTAAANVLRNANYVNGVLQPPLIEAAAINPLLFSNDFTNGAWSKVSCTPTPGVADPAGGNSATTLTATAPNGGVRQILSAGSAIVRTSSFWMRRRTGTGTVSIQKPDGSANVVVALTSAWTVFSAVGGASATRNSIVTIATSGDAIDIWMPQMEDGAVATSTIVPATTNAPVTRAADIDQMLAATANGYSRQLGSFLDDKFTVGMKIAMLGFTQNPATTIKSVSGPSVVTDPAPPQLDAALAGRSISFGLPIGSGSVSHCRIAGDIETDEGVLGDQAVAIIPIEIMANV